MLLLIDNGAAHNWEGLGPKHARVLFLSASTTSSMQLSDQGIIHHVKMVYNWHVCAVGSFATDLQNRDILDAVRKVVIAWDKVHPMSLQTAPRRVALAPTLPKKLSVSKTELQGETDSPTDFQEFTNIDDKAEESSKRTNEATPRQEDVEENEEAKENAEQEPERACVSMS